MTSKWFDKYCQKHYSESKKTSDDEEFELFYELSEYDAPVDTIAAWAKVCNKIQPTKNSFWSLWKVAAAIILISSLSVIGYLKYSPTDIAQRELASKDAISKYELPDGTRLTLSRNSSVALTEEDFLGERNLQLEGKAYFNVTKGSPFTISTKNGDVKVLGTSFDVDARDGQLIVKVYSGIVQISKGDNSTKLHKGEIGIIDNTELTVSNNTNVNSQSWRTGDFKFDNQPLKEIIPQLEEFYNVDIKTSKAIRECRVTAEFDGDSLAEVIKTLTSVLNIKSKKSGNKISLSGKGC
ncbi:FecR family protein [Marinoscillum pacificum]|uniref:FecR family protein n=1 Tax=Marinoscillum pacificum TaxID=392723 RepID=UPI002157458C|nr:FecR family protein [Marinoscillum pacificum]